MNFNLFKPKFDEAGFSAIISKEMTVGGYINFRGTLRIQGIVQGDIACATEAESTPDSADGVIVESSGNVNCKRIECSNVIIEGDVKCDLLYAHERLVVRSGGRLSDCAISYKTIVVEDGAMLENCTLNRIC